MTLSRQNEADLLRDTISVTLPGGSNTYVVQDGATEDLYSIVQNNLGTQDHIQASYYVNKILADTRNHLSASTQQLETGQVIYIPKRIAS